MARANGLLIFGIFLAVVGLLGLAIPVFTTQKTEDVARIGNVKIQNTEDVPHSIPPLLSGGVLVLGIILIGAGLYTRR
jgi:hypothetical protein